MQVLLLFMTSLVSCEIQWTQYSDRADIPKSKKARDRMRAKLKEIDPSRLPVDDRAAYDRLSDILNEDLVEPDEAIGLELLFVPMVFAIVGLGVYLKLSRQAQLQALQPVDMDEAREARLKRFD
jgi:hypothetical protein